MLRPAPTAFSNFLTARVPFGLYSGPVMDMSTRAWSSVRRSQRKVWMYAGAFNSQYYTGFAIADAGIAATAFAYFYDAENHRFAEEKVTLPFGFPRAFDPDLNSAWRLKGFAINRSGNKIICTYSGRKLKLEMQLTEVRAGASTIAPAGFRPFHHTYKNLLMPVQVKASLEGRNISFEGKIGSIDFSKGYPPRHTFWNWASLNGITEGGLALGINLVADFNNGIENALWVNDQIVPLSQALFSYKRPAEKSKWQITTTDGRLEMEFFPNGQRSEHINALLMQSRFVQPFGSFKGTINLDGAKLPFTAYGVVEEHQALW